ncbi:MAG: type II toxin-antitoxin system prevent-host-death family antitoxin [Nitrococcus sp.]|nr:type II toxin-antitoxin system prevent-host-death family antitoxin [Nitrococcus sp.]
MATIGIRELRQHASRYLRRVKQGEMLTVTERGEPIAELRPLARHENTIDRLEREGRITPARGNLLDLAPMLPPDGYPPLSEVLDELREDQVS